MIKPPSSSYQTIGKAAKFLKLDFSAEDMAAFAKEYEITTDSLRCIEELFVRMQENKQKKYCPYAAETEQASAKRAEDL